MVKSCSSIRRRWVVFTFRVLVPSATFFDRGLETDEWKERRDFRIKTAFFQTCIFV